jgi:hypothetical protein
MSKMIPVFFGLALTGALVDLWAPPEAHAMNIVLKAKSIVCDIELSGGGPRSIDHYVSCAVNIKEIRGYCKNPAGEAFSANGQPFEVQSFAVAASATNDWTKVKNGFAQNELVISNEMIQEAFDIHQARQQQSFVFLKTATQPCKNKWTWAGWFVTKADAAIAVSVVPSAIASDGTTVSGKSSYVHQTNGDCPAGTTSATLPPVIDDGPCKCVPIPKWNWTWDESGETGTPGSGAIWDGTTYTYTKVCDFIGKPFTYCSRFPNTNGPDGSVADSGLRIYDNAIGTSTGTPGQQIAVTDKIYLVNNCYLWRDVNKDPNFDLSAFGGYDPDTDNIRPPQTGNVDGGDDHSLGGFVLTRLSFKPDAINYYTGTCHQHGGDKTNAQGYKFQQNGPLRNLIDPSTGAIVVRNPMCQGGSQLMDGIYDDGILP